MTTSGSNEDKILLIEGARQIGKSYIIRDVGTELYDNYVEINFAEDDAGDKIFRNIRTTEEFYLNLSMVAGAKAGQIPENIGLHWWDSALSQFWLCSSSWGKNTGIGLSAAEACWELHWKRPFRFLSEVLSPKKMYQLDFENSWLPNNFGEDAIAHLRQSFSRNNLWPRRFTIRC